jgi:pseudaminic acid synthase
MNKAIKIGKHLIGKGHKPFVVAEMSGNHNQSLKKAIEIVDAAADAGAHAIKLQTYTADTITMKGVLTITDKKSLWCGKDLHELYKLAYTPWDWHQPIIKRAKERGLVWFSSPFDETAVDFLESLNAPIYKIASFENTHHPLLKKVAKTGKPVIMSTGVATLADIKESVAVLKKNGCKDLILLKCTSTYPSTPENTNLLTIPDMEKKFGCHVGLSDHTMGIGVSVASVALGACLIEKHFCLGRKLGGVDSAFSMEPAEMKELVIESERAYLAMGNVSYTPGKAEQKSLLYKRSIYASKNIKAGEKFSTDNIKVIRPADGLHPRYFESLLGKRSPVDIKAGTPLKQNLIKAK